MRYGRVDHDDGLRLATTDPDGDGPVWMVNLMQYREVAVFPSKAAFPATVADPGRLATDGTTASRRSPTPTR